MTIIHPIDDFLYTLFPSIEKNQNSLENALTEFYSVGNIKPLIEFKDDFVKITIDYLMGDALNYFKGIPKAEIKKIAFEIATIGTQGIDPNQKNYSIPSIKNSSFFGYKTLAYYYVSWALAIPEMLNQLQMPFDKEYQLATKFLKL